jgi:cation-transporting P-type ATPase I
MTRAAEPPRVLHSLPGRVRIHVPGMSSTGVGAAEQRLRRIRGVVRVSASSLTENVLVEFDSARLEPGTIVKRLARMVARPADSPSGGGHGSNRDRATVLQTRASARRARVAVRGLDRDPELGRRLVDRLSRRPEVRRVSPSPLTSRVLVEFAEGTESIQGVLDEIADLELPGAEGEEIPAHPLDPASIIEGGAKTIGATLGLLLLVGRKIAGSEGAPVPVQGPGEVAGAIGLVEGIPPVAHRIESTLGHQRKELLFAATALIGMSASGNALGLMFAGAAALRLLTESVSRRRAWREYEQRLGSRAAVHPGAVITLSRAERSPLAATVLEGFGVVSALDGSPQPLFPGQVIDPGAPVYSGNVTVQLRGEERFAPAEPGGAARITSFDRYMRLIPYSALLYAAATGAVTRSPARMLTALLLVNPIPALAGRESADRGASARVIRAGVTVAGSRSGRAITRPDVLVVDEPRTLCGGWELSRVLTRVDGFSEERLLALADAISISAGSPWGVTLPLRRRQSATDGTFDGRVASAEIDGERWLVESVCSTVPGMSRRAPDEHVLMLRRQRDRYVSGAVALRPHLTRGVAVLVETCRAANVKIELATRSSSPLTRRIAKRAGIPLVAGRAEDRVRHWQDRGKVVAVVGDSARSAVAFEGCDLAIGLTSGLSGRFPARADLLAPRLEAVAAITEAGVRRDAAVRDAVLMSIAANAGGAVWGGLSGPAFRLGTRPAQIGGLAAMSDSAWRLRGGRRARTVVERLSDPLPERWGRESIEAVLGELKTTSDGLTGAEAKARWQPAREVEEQGGLIGLMLEQIRSPVVAVLGAGAALSVAMGMIGDVAMIAAVVAANAVVGAWQEGRAGAATRALHELSAGTARVIRDGRQKTVPQADLVPGDLILLASGDRVPADARLIWTEALEIDEAALTGESIPVLKSAEDGSESDRIVLEGTDIVTGTGRAVVVAVGEDTRMGAIAAALAEDSDRESPLDLRLGKMLVHALPWVAAGGLVVTAAGMLWGRPPLAQLALGASVAVAAVPEGLPLIAGVAEAAVAQRLANRKALVTRLSAVEALGRVDVACVDKTGTLTAGTLALTLVADAHGEQASPAELTPTLQGILRMAAIASPAPGALDAKSHPTDVAVLGAARAAGLHAGLNIRQAESPFDPSRGFHATLAEGRLAVKGAAEILADRCAFVRLEDGDASLEKAGRARLLDRATQLARQGLRILLVAEGPVDASVEDPYGLTALGFIGISDPLRPGAAEAVARCRDAGVRVVMLTGDHPATAKAIARDAGLPTDERRMLTGEEVEGLDDESLGERLEHATVIARTMPLQKLRIVEILRARGHVVAMTGDGVNDAPALRLADVGVAMGRAGTEVARQAADLVLMDDEFATLAEALVEGRGFWRNMRRALGLLLGGNSGEVGLMIASALTGLASPLTTRQVLTVNLVTDVLPAVAVAIQPPEHRNLAELSREGGAALDAPLRADIIRRGIATGAPSFGAYLFASRIVGPAAGRSVAYVSIVTTQLAQTVDLGQAEGRLTGSVLGAVGGSLAVVAATLAIPGLRGFLALSPPTLPGVLIAGGASLLAVLLGRIVPVERWLSSGPIARDRIDVGAVDALA